MRKLLLSILFVGSVANSQTTLFEDGFETYPNFVINNFGTAWNGIDVDMLNTYTGGTDTPNWDNAGDPMAFQIFNPTVAGVTNATTGSDLRNFDPHGGLKYAACWAGVPATPIVANNDWMISPPITLGSSGNEIRFWAKSMSSSYGLERYRVAIYVGSGMPTTAQLTFVAGSPVALTAPYPNWVETIIPTATLNTYNGQTIRVGIQCVTADAYMFMVDDFKVTTTALSTNEFSASKFSAYPNPANNVVTVSNNDSILLSEVAITDINGRVVKTINVDNLSSVEINVSELNSGIYFMNITSDSGKAVKKFIKN